MTDTPVADPAAVAAPEAAALPSDILARPAPDAAIPPKPDAAAPAPSAAEVLYGEKETPDGKAAAGDDAAGLPDGAKPGDPKPSEGDAKGEGADDPTDPAPALTLESFADLKVPDTIAVSAPILAEAKDLFLAENISPEAANKLLSFYAKASTDAAAAQASAWAATQAEWTTSINAMPEFQGEQRARSEAVLGQAIEEFGDPTVREFFRMTGDHPGVVRMLLAMSSALIEEGPMNPGKPTGAKAAPRSLGEVLYSSSKTN